MTPIIKAFEQAEVQVLGLTILSSGSFSHYKISHLQRERVKYLVVTAWQVVNIFDLEFKDRCSCTAKSMY